MYQVNFWKYSLFNNSMIWCNEIHLKSSVSQLVVEKIFIHLIDHYLYVELKADFFGILRSFSSEFLEIQNSSRWNSICTSCEVTISVSSSNKYFFQSCLWKSLLVFFLLLLSTFPFCLTSVLKISRQQKRSFV